MSFPDLIILLVVVSVLGPGLPQIIVTLGLLLGIAGSRIIRSAVVSVRENMYVHAAQSIGASTRRILWRHILPNIMPPIIVLFTTRVGTVILAESSLSFLGLGVPPPTPTWGGMLSGSRPHLHVPGTVAGAGAGPVPDGRRLCHQRVRRRLARSARSAHARLKIKTKIKVSKAGGNHVSFSRRFASGRGISRRHAVVRNARFGAIGAAAEARRHARGRHRLRHAVGAVVGFRRLELEAQPRHRRGLRTAVRRRPHQVETARRQASRSMPTPGFLRTRSAANSPRHGPGSKTRFASKSTCARA